ncbi:MAG: rhodanese-like domain-containing protein [Phycisphaerae bacterium]|nr:rhodanese-like domain-containing protein [Saprospiraceae bacterium]
MRTLFFAAVAAAFCFFSCQNNTKQAPKMTGLAGNLQDSSIIRIWPREMDSLLRINPNIPVIDVRTESEFRTSHIFRSMSCEFNDRTFSQRIVRLNVEAPVIIYDTNSSASLLAAEQMKQLGFKRIYELAGGLFSFAREGKALVTSESKIDSSTILK